MSHPISRWLRSTEWLEGHLHYPDVVVLDASWYLPAQKRDPEAEYAEGHIPGAIRFDIDAVSDHGNPLPHMLPSAQDFARMVGAMGIGDGNTVVVYDGAGLFSAPRVWWMFRLFGVERCFILDGGLPRWKAEGRALETETPKRQPRTFTARFNRTAVADMADVKKALDTGKAQVVDARAADRFTGAAPEIRPGLESGHMPGAFNVPSSAVLKDGALASHDALKAAFGASGLDVTKPVITSCGSGVSAAILWLALDALGHEPQALYDGSWTEWASTPGNPIVKD